MLASGRQQAAAWKQIYSIDSIHVLAVADSYFECGVDKCSPQFEKYGECVVIVTPINFWREKYSVKVYDSPASTV